jgi:hypothetical protein
MKKIFIILTIILLGIIALTFPACSSSVSKNASTISAGRSGMAAPATSTSMPQMAYPTTVPAPSVPGMNYGGAKPSSNEAYSNDAVVIPNSNDSAAADIERKIIKTGYITLTVKNVQESIDKIVSLIGELGGYIVSSNKSDDPDYVRGDVALRIPAEKYDDALAKIRVLAIKVPTENTNSQDVTEEYIDLQARLKNLEATEAQYLVLLNKASTVQDILNVQRELSNTRSQIESLKARIQYLDKTTTMSLINVHLQEEKTITANNWSASDTFVGAVNGLKTFGQAIVNVLIWIGIFSPLWIIVGLVVFFVLRASKKAKSK